MRRLLYLMALAAARFHLENDREALAVAILDELSALLVEWGGVAEASEVAALRRECVSEGESDGGDAGDDAGHAARGEKDSSSGGRAKGKRHGGR